MKAADVVTLVAVLLVIGAVILGRRNGRRQQAAALAAARAEGHAAALASAVSTSGVVFNGVPGVGPGADIEAIACRVAEIIGYSREADDSSAIHGRRTLQQLGPADGDSGGMVPLQDPARHNAVTSRNHRPVVVARPDRDRGFDVRAVAKEVTDL